MMAAAVRSSPMPSSPNSGKRKRGQADQGNGRDMKLQNTNGPDNSDFAFLSALQESDGNAQTAQAALSVPLPHSQYPDSFDTSSQLPTFDDPGATQHNQTNQIHTPGAQALFEARQQQQTQKPVVGSTAWHQQRKDNHKEVERRRREVINEGIENIAKVVPGAEKNKGAILARTCSYIQELKDSQTKFENERILFENTLRELTNRYETMHANYAKERLQSEKWQRRCKDAGLSFDDYNIDGEGVHQVDLGGSNGIVGVHDDFGTGVDNDPTSAGV